jgi:hypothetical protein
MMMIEIYDPSNESDPRPDLGVASTAREGRARRAVLGVLDNRKPNFDELMRRVLARIQAVETVEDVDYRTKAAAGHSAPEEWLAGLSEQSSLVLTGSGD